ncbi:MAG TPA: hypothetical protein VK674_06020 [Candidatus Limnocylindria bacterium]|nr:hypothetical protein [Candidatus Limnocylindria bacterium]
MSEFDKYSASNGTGLSPDTVPAGEASELMLDGPDELFFPDHEVELQIVYPDHTKTITIRPNLPKAEAEAANRESIAATGWPRFVRDEDIPDLPMM